jgi:ribonuclease E
VGKVAGTVAKGVGAVAGGVAGAGTALKKGWNAGKAAVARAGDDEPETVGGPEAQPSATDINKDGPAGTAQAKPLQGQAKVAADKTAAATADQDPATAGQTMYSQVKANIGKLDKKGKQRILQLLQKSMAAPEPQAAPAAGAMGQMANQLTKPAPQAAPAATVKPAFGGDSEPAAAPTVAPTAPAAEPTTAPVQQTAPKKRAPRKTAAPTTAPTAPAAEPKKRAPKKQAAPAQTQAQIDADRERIMGVTSDSIVRRQPMMAEGFSLFRKRT